MGYMLRIRRSMMQTMRDLTVDEGGLVRECSLVSSMVGL